MKKNVLLCVALFMIVFLSAPRQVMAESNTLDLTVQIMIQNNQNAAQKSVTIQADETSRIIEQMTGDNGKASFTEIPIEHLKLSVDDGKSETTPTIDLSLYRGKETALLSTSPGQADVSVAKSASGLFLYLFITKSGQIVPYTVSNDGKTPPTPSASSQQAMAKNELPDIKFCMTDNLGKALNKLSISIDAAEAKEVNGDGEFYLSAVKPGTHSITVYSQSGAEVASSFFTVSRDGSTGLTNTNPTNPTITIDAAVSKLNVSAGLSEDAVKFRRVSSSAISPGTKASAEVTVTIKGCLLDESNNPLPSMHVLLGNISSTTNQQGIFILKDLPIDKYNLIINETNGKKVADGTLIIENGMATELRDITVDRATLSIDRNSITAYVTVQLSSDNAILFISASEDTLSIPTPFETAASQSSIQSDNTNNTTQTNQKSNSYLQIYLYLFVIIVVLIILVLFLIKKVLSRSRSKH